MIKNKYKNVLFITALILPGGSQGQSLNAERAHYNYMMFCQGCHSPDASGSEGHVPKIKDTIGHFLKIEDGREYLVRVPGSANAAITDKELTELLNWMILEFAGDSLPENFRAYEISEVAALRTRPLNEVNNHRLELMKRIVALEEIAELK